MREYLYNNFTNFLKEEGVRHQLSVEYMPQQNGVAERTNHTLVEMARCMILQASLPDSLWAEAVNTATYLRNRCVTKCLDGITPFEAWTQRKPYVDFFRTIGSKTIALNENQRGRKFQPKGDEYLLVDYSDESKAYRLWKPGTKTIIKARDVKFFERIESPTESSTRKVLATPNTLKETSDEEMRNEDTEDEVKKDPQGSHDESTEDKLEENETRRLGSPQDH